MTRRTAALSLTIALAIGLAVGCQQSPEARKERHLSRGDAAFDKSAYDDAILEYMNVLQIDPESAHAFRQIGLAHYQLGQFGQSYRFLLKAQQVDPDDLATRIKLGTLQLAGRNFDEARETASFVLEKDPENFEGLLLMAGTARTPEEGQAALEALERRRAKYGDRAKFHLAVGSLRVGRNELEEAERSFLEAVKVEPDSVEAHLLLGEFYGARKNAEGAERELRKAAELAPITNSLARFRLVDLYLTIGRREEARKVLEETTQKAPDFLPAWRRLAELDASENKNDSALAIAERILEKNPNDVEGRHLRGRLLLTKGNVTEAMQDFRRVLKAEPTFAPARYNLAVALVKEGRPEEAKTELREALDAVPNFPQATILLATMNLRAGAYPLVIEDLERFLKERPEFVEAYVILGTAYLSRNEPARAMDTFRKITEIAPQDPRGPHFTAVALLAQKKMAEAKEQFEAALKLSPGYIPSLVQLSTTLGNESGAPAAIARVELEAERAPASGEVQELLGGILAANGDPVKAEKAYQRAIELSPARSDAYAQLGRLYAATGRNAEALKRLEEAREKNPRSAGVHMMIGMIHEMDGRIPEAQKSYEKVLEIDSRFVPALNNLAYLLSAHGGDREKALQLAQLARESRPEDPNVADTLGWILYERGVYDRALKLLAESAAALPSHPEVQFHHGMALHRTGDGAGAKKALEHALQLSQNFAGADEAKAVLKEIR